VSVAPERDGALIELVDIRKVYQMGAAEVNALDGVSLRIQRGEYVAVMGPSGSGKSTLMNIVGCLDTPTSGSYKLRGTEIRDRDDDELWDSSSRPSTCSRAPTRSTTWSCR